MPRWRASHDWPAACAPGTGSSRCVPFPRARPAPRRSWWAPRISARSPSPRRRTHLPLPTCPQGPADNPSPDGPSHARAQPPHRDRRPRALPPGRSAHGHVEPHVDRLSTRREQHRRSLRTHHERAPHSLSPPIHRLKRRSSPPRSLCTHDERSPPSLSPHTHQPLRSLCTHDERGPPSLSPHTHLPPRSLCTHDERGPPRLSPHIDRLERRSSPHDERGPPSSPRGGPGAGEWDAAGGPRAWRAGGGSIVGRAPLFHRRRAPGTGGPA